MKRIFDIWLAAILTAVASPILIAVTIMVGLLHGRPVLFRQKRPGLHGELFDIMKFRTMTNGVNSDGELLPDRERLTKLGSFLRATSLDELPELFNVLKGDMSLVGPRPLLPRYMPYFTDREMARFEVRPGITGWAQVNGRNNASWDDRMAMDIWYVENQSLALDLRILAETALSTIRRRDIVIDPASTMLDFDAERRSHGVKPRD
ncbi:sugar transferase [Dietzia cinnamea]|uniref:sugar transferase n=1 Tax=Dietzia cinnamea TaxID=321318 RepID=UPI0021A5275D|nr:sugar transferase [Dietzia cinnamea]MCT2141231.1 sugar transferase [Dietzia cinnamea]